MKPYYQDKHATIYCGDCRDVLPSLPAQHFHTCVTSPPYFGLRDYGTAEWEGGDAGCSHAPSRDAVIAATMNRTGLNTSTDGLSENQMAAAYARMMKSPCPRCGAIRIDRQIGLEPTPDEFVAEMVKVFREVRRVLRDDGTVWLNLGDSYASSPASGGSKSSGLNAKRDEDGSLAADNKSQGITPAAKYQRPEGLKPKDLIGIPWRVAFALQADGWYLRQDIIWAKPNPIPESVKDRCTKAHEYIFLLSKSRRYWFDAKAIAETSIHAGKTVTIGEKSLSKGQAKGANILKSGNANSDSVAVTENRNRRSVWTVATQPFPQAHFATFPPALIKPCILAGCPIGGNVLDPFGGAGTTGMVADRLQRHATLIELKPEYAKMALDRIMDDAPLFAERPAPSEQTTMGFK